MGHLTMDGGGLKDVQVFLYDLSIDDDRDPLERVLFKHPSNLREDLTLQVCGPIAAVAGFFKDTFEELNYIKMKYKNILISSHGDILLMVVDLKKHRKREHVDLICKQLLQTIVRTKSEDPKDPSESGIESGTESDPERKSNPDDAKSEAVDIKSSGSCDDAKEKLIATVTENI